MDEKKIEEAVRLFLEGIGEDVNREGLLETPARVARMCRQIYGGLTQDAEEHLRKQFESANSQIVLERDITFYSTCEHHLLPFWGKAHVAICRTARWRDLASWPARWRFLRAVLRFRRTSPARSPTPWKSI